MTALVAEPNGRAFARYLGPQVGELQAAMMEGIMHALPAVWILMLVGMTRHLDHRSTVPTLVYYGLKLISPKVFLATFICALSPQSLGTSFGTIGTIGLALIGIGEGLNTVAHGSGRDRSRRLFRRQMSRFPDTQM